MVNLHFFAFSEAVYPLIKIDFTFLWELYFEHQCCIRVKSFLFCCLKHLFWKTDWEWRQWQRDGARDFSNPWNITSAMMKGWVWYYSTADTDCESFIFTEWCLFCCSGTSHSYCGPPWLPAECTCPSLSVFLSHDSPPGLCT